MPKKQPALHLSPSELHQHLMATTPLATLGYDGGGVPAWQRRLRKKVRQLTGFDEVTSLPRCDLNVRVQVWTPRHLSAEQRRLFTELAAHEAEGPGKDGGLWTKIKEVLGA